MLGQCLAKKNNIYFYFIFYCVQHDGYTHMFERMNVISTDNKWMLEGGGYSEKYIISNAIISLKHDGLVDRAS